VARDYCQESGSAITYSAIPNAVLRYLSVAECRAHPDAKDAPVLGHNVLISSVTSGVAAASQPR
jgi:hypothetical protein